MVPENNEKQNIDESHLNKYQKHGARSYGYISVCVDNKFSKSFTSYLGENAVYNFINNMMEESEYCSEIMKKN